MPRYRQVTVSSMYIYTMIVSLCSYKKQVVYGKYRESNCIVHRDGLTPLLKKEFRGYDCIHASVGGS